MSPRGLKERKFRRLVGGWSVEGVGLLTEVSYESWSETISSQGGGGGC